MGVPIVAAVWHRGHREPGAPRFQHAGASYDLNALFRLLDEESNGVMEVALSKLEWNLAGRRIDPAHARATSLQNPILVTAWQGKIEVLDGWNRLWKARDEGRATISALWVRREDLDRVRLSSGKTYDDKIRRVAEMILRRAGS